MNMIKVLVCILTSISIIGCGDNSEGIYAGVSLGGTGVPTIGSNIPPVKTDDLHSISPNEFILWSQGKIDHQCSGLKISTQLMHPITKYGVELGYGYPIILEDLNYNNRMGIIITVKNETTSNLYNFLENCQPKLKLKAKEDEEEQDLVLENECSNTDSLVKLKSGEETQFKYIFPLPIGDLARDLVYIHEYSFDNDISDRNKCEISYPIFLEK